MPGNPFFFLSDSLPNACAVCVRRFLFSRPRACEAVRACVAEGRASNYAVLGVAKGVAAVCGVSACGR